MEVLPTTHQQFDTLVKTAISISHATPVLDTLYAISTTVPSHTDSDERYDRDPNQPLSSDPTPQSPTIINRDTDYTDSPTPGGLDPDPGTIDTLLQAKLRRLSRAFRAVQKVLNYDSSVVCIVLHTHIDTYIRTPKQT